MKKLIGLLILISAFLGVLYYASFYCTDRNNKESYIKRECEISTDLNKLLLNLKLTSEKLIFTIEGDSLNLVKLIGSKDEVLIYRIPRFYCSSCVDRELDLINHLNKEKLLPVVVLSSFCEYRDFKVFSHYNASDKIIFYNTVEKFLSIDSLSKSYYFTFNPKLVIKKAFFPVKLSAKQSSDFLKSL